jgi:protocatechuate 3,4-dioxygenase, alpha subunit
VSGTTPSQTVGPFFSLGLPWEDGPFVVPEGTEGAIRVSGRVFDGAGEPVTDALIETWQADPDGRFDHPDDPRGRVPGFRGFARCPTGDDGRWEIVTLKPGPVPDGNGYVQAPHLAVSLFARGLLSRVVTRIYFGDEPEANADDPVLALLDRDHRATLVAAPAERGYAIDFYLQGARETAFFRV